MTQTIFDFVDNAFVLSYARQLAADSLFGLKLFPVSIVPEINYEYIKGARGQKSSIMAEVVAWESSAPLVPREGLTKVSGELPPIKQKSRISEKELIKIFSPRSSAERTLAIDKIYNDVADRVSGIYSRLNKIIMESLANGTVTFISEGVKLVVDWNLPGAHKATPSIPWSTVATAVPTKNLMDMVAQLVADTGIRPNRAITSTTVISYLLQNADFKSAIFGANTARVLTLDLLNQYLASLQLPKFVAYDEVVKRVDSNGDVVTERYYPVNKVTLLNSDEHLGDTLVGPTAEGIVGLGTEEAPGVYAEVIATSDPVNIFTMATAVAFPTFPSADTIGILTVAA
jgi:hypothetical protein